MLIVAFIVGLNVYRADKLTMQNNVNVAVFQWRYFTTTQHNKHFSTESTDANVILPTSFKSYNDSIYCKTMVLMKLRFPICLYDPKLDRTISAGLVAGKYWEENIVCSFVRLLRLDQRLHFVDIGANIGLHSLPAARITQVISVEPNWFSMARLAKGVYLGGAVSSNITLVHNAISNIRTTLRMGSGRTSQGHAFLMNKTKCKGRCNALPLQTRTIILDDLLPLMQTDAAVLKVDVEGHEDKVFTEPSAAQFFNRIDVPLIFMEWNMVKRHSVDVRRLLSFFYNRSYTVFDLENAKLTKHYSKWPDNVLFKKLPLISF